MNIFGFSLVKRMLAVGFLLFTLAGITAPIISHGETLENILNNGELKYTTGANGTGMAPIKLDPIILASRVINYALTFLGILTVSLILYAGFLWMTSQGEKEKVAKAKKILIYSFLGLVVILSAYGISLWVFSVITENIITEPAARSLFEHFLV